MSNIYASWLHKGEKVMLIKTKTPAIAGALIRSIRLCLRLIAVSYTFSCYTDSVMGMQRL